MASVRATMQWNQASWKPCSASAPISRPGLRIETLGEYMKRLKRSEEIIHSLSGIDRAFAIQAGREVQITVLPNIVDDDQLLNLARDIAQCIEKELSHPGRIKATLLRKKQVVECTI